MVRSDIVVGLLSEWNSCFRGMTVDLYMRLVLFRKKCVTLVPSIEYRYVGIGMRREWKFIGLCTAYVPYIDQDGYCGYQIAT